MTAPDDLVELHDLDLVERLRGYNPPDRTIFEQRQMAQDIAEAAAELTRLNRVVGEQEAEIALERGAKVSMRERGDDAVQDAINQRQRAERAEAELNAARIVLRQSDALKAELAAAREDAERYRWLRVGFNWIHADVYGTQRMERSDEEGPWGPVLDSIIDAAMQEQKP